MHRRALSVLFVLVLASVGAFAQEFRATISGHVFDSSGGGVPNATVQAVHVGTAETSTATTNSVGAYAIPFLRIGQYKLTITAPGFKQYVRENIVLQVNQMAGIDVTLEVGAVTEAINVTAEVALLETQTANRGGVVNQTQITELPLNSRNPFMLGMMMSGVTFRGAPIWMRPFDNGAIAEWSVNGGRQSNNEFLMDGAPNNGQAGGNNIAYVPIVDAVQEFNVQSNSYDSQYGHTGGGVFNVLLKSGTQSLHGAAWEFMRRKSLDANLFQNNAVGSPKPGHSLDQYGFQFEGPVYLPKLLKKDGAVKLFFLTSFENYQEDWPQFLRTSWPAAEMRDGDFSRLTNAAGRPVTIYNPFTTSFAANGDPIRQPFDNNRIPGNMIHSVARNVTKYMPVPNTTTAAVRYATQNFLLPEYAAGDDFYNLILKFDWNFGDRHRAFFRHASNDRTEDRCDNGVCVGPGMSGQQPFQRINDAYVADWVYTAAPTVVINVRASHNRFIEKGFGRGNEKFDLTSLGLSPSLTAQLPSPQYFGRWEFGGYNSLGRYQSFNFTNNYGLAANVTKISGSHTMKMGIDVRRIHYIQQNSGNILLFQGQTQWTQRLWNQGEDTAGDGYASFLLGLAGGSSNYPLYPFFQQWYLAPYIHDDWKVSRRLTLNLGLRWDINRSPTEKYNRLNRGFNPTVASPVISQLPADAVAQYPNLRNLRGGLDFAGVGGVPQSAGNQDWNDFQPRIGAAFQIKNNLVMRGGWGLYYMNPNNDSLRTVGFDTSTPIVTSLDGGRTPITNVLGNPYPSGISLPTGASLGAATFVGRNTNWYDANFRTPYVHQFSFGFQYRVTSTSTLDISYVGSRTIGANSERAFNIPSAEFRKSCNLQEGGSPIFCDAALPNPFRNVPAFAGTNYSTANTLSRYNLARPHPQFAGDMLQQGRNDSNIWYNSLQVNYNQRLARGLTLLGNVTFSKMVERWGFNDAFNNVQQQGLYLNDRPWVIKTVGVYDLPFGKGQRFATGSTGIANKLISGWEVTGFYNHGAGEPTNLPGNVIMLKDPLTGVAAPNWKAHQVRGWSPCVLRQFNDGSTSPTATSLAQGCGTDFGNYAWLQTAGYAPRYTPFRSGQVRKHKAFVFDASLNKTTTITERVRVQFGVEAFNLFNHYYFGRDNSFNTDPTSPNFGTIFPSQAGVTGTGYARQVQIRMKLLW